MDISTKLLAEYIDGRKTPLSAISDATKIPYQRIWLNLSKSPSALKSNANGLYPEEFMRICNFLGKSPLDFFPDGSTNRRDSA